MFLLFVWEFIRDIRKIINILFLIQILLCARFVGEFTVNSFPGMSVKIYEKVLSVLFNYFFADTGLDEAC